MRTRRSLIDLDDLSAEEIESIFEQTRDFEARAPGRLLDGIDVVNLFFEQSTRTFTSFNLAQMRLGANVVNLSPKDLSLATKGETIEDTMLTLSAMGIGVVVIRHPEAGFPARVAAAFDGHVVNAGDGSHAHPTQALLDLFTLRDEFGSLEGRNVAIVGRCRTFARRALDDSRSRAASARNAVLVGPAGFSWRDDAVAGAAIERDFDTVLAACRRGHLAAHPARTFRQDADRRSRVHRRLSTERASASSDCVNIRSSCILVRTIAGWSSTTRCSSSPAGAMHVRCFTACSSAWPSSICW